MAQLVLERGQKLTRKQNLEQLHYILLQWRDTLMLLKCSWMEGQTQNWLVYTDSHRQNGWTPLHSAVFTRQRDVVKLLLDRQADPNIASYSGITPLGAAERNKEKDIVKITRHYRGL